MIVFKTMIQVEQVDSCSICKKQECPFKKKMKDMEGYQVYVIKCPEQEVKNGF